MWCYSAIVGLTTAVILFCSHFHQIQGDMAAGKVSPLVRLGTQRGCNVSGATLLAPASPPPLLPGTLSVVTAPEDLNSHAWQPAHPAI